MLNIFALSPRACPDSHVVFILLVLFSVVVGIYTALLIRRGEIKTAIIVFVLALLVPLVLWIFDGYTAAAQSLDLDETVSFKCTTEGLFSQLSRLNYGLWHILIIVPIVSTVSFFIMKVKNTKP